MDFLLQPKTHFHFFDQHFFLPSITQKTLFLKVVDLVHQRDHERKSSVHFYAQKILSHLGNITLLKKMSQINGSLELSG